MHREAEGYPEHLWGWGGAPWSQELLRPQEDPRVSSSRTFSLLPYTQPVVALRAPGTHWRVCLLTQSAVRLCGHACPCIRRLAQSLESRTRRVSTGQMDGNVKGCLKTVMNG